MLRQHGSVKGTGGFPTCAYRDRKEAQAGIQRPELGNPGLDHGKAVFPWANSGRALIPWGNDGLTKLEFDNMGHRAIAAGISGKPRR